MMEKLFDSVGTLLKAIICGVILIAAAAAAVTFTYFVVMSCFRLIGSLWTHLFSRPWP